MGVESVRSVANELPAQAAWMRKLARGLVRDASSADDIAQETALAALRSGPHEPAALRGWLGRVAGNFARKRGRDAASRERIEREVARAEAQPGVDDALARLEMQRALVDELGALPEPYRSTLLRRYFDGWSAARIAREQRIAAATVRWRIQRGLELMRERLDRRHAGGRASWQLALVPLMNLRPLPWWSDLARVGPVRAVEGALVMKGVLQVTVVCAASLAVGLSVWWGTSAQHAATPPVIEAAAAPATVDSVAPPKIAAERSTAEIEPAREATASSSSTPVVAPAVETPKSARVEARVVDGEARPVVGASMVENARDGAPVVISDRDGKLALELALDAAREDRVLRFEAKGLATSFVEAHFAAGTTTQLGDVVLAPSGVVRGRVVDTLEHGIAGARVLVTAPDIWYPDPEASKRVGPRVWPGAPSSLSRADGTFEVEGVPLGGARVWGEVTGMRFAFSEPITVRADGAGGEVVLVVEALGARDEISGVVLAPDGTAVAKPSVRVLVKFGGSSSSFSILGDEQGKFHFRVIALEPHEISAADPQHRWQDVRAPAVAAGTRDLELRFLENRFVELAVHRGGDPVARFVARTIDDRDQTVDSVRELGAGAGRARIRAPVQRFWIEVAAAGCALERKGPFEAAAPPSELDFELKAAAGISGRVTSAGAPLAGATVTLSRCRNSTEEIEVEGYPALVEPRATDEFVTADDGTFFLRVPEGGDFVVRAEHAGHAAAELGPIHGEPGVGMADVDLELGSGGAIEGRVLTPPGRSPSGIVVAINHGDAHPRTVRSDDQGGFRFERVMPGRWLVARGRNEVSPDGRVSWGIGTNKNARPIDFNCTVQEGSTTRVDVDLRDDQPCEISGHLAINGAPARHWTLAVWPGDASTYTGDLPSTSIDDGGNFQIAIDEPGIARFSFRPPAELGQQGRFETRTELRRGENVWKADFALARLDGHGPPPKAGDEPLTFSSGKGEVECSLMVRIGDDGEFSLPLVPIGRGKFQRLERGEGGTMQWIDVLEVDVKPAENARVELP